MSTSSEMITYLGRGITFLIPIWKITSRDGIVAAYAAHTRKTSGYRINGAPPFEVDGILYRIAPIQPTRDMQKVGLNPNTTQLTGIFDDLITRVDVENGRWKMAEIEYQYVNPLDLTLGGTGAISGVAGKWTPNGIAYDVELMSKTSLLTQQIGEMTSPTDRNNFPAGLNKADWTTTRLVNSSADRRHLVVDGAAISDHYYRYGVLKVTIGANIHSPGMEIKDNVGNTIELQLPMPEDFDNGDTVTLLAGYDGTREQLRDKFGDMENGNMEPDLPGLKVVLSYPE